MQSYKRYIARKRYANRVHNDNHDYVAALAVADGIAVLVFVLVNRTKMCMYNMCNNISTS